MAIIRHVHGLSEDLQQYWNYIQIEKRKKPFFLGLVGLFCSCLFIHPVPRTDMDHEVVSATPIWRRHTLVFSKGFGIHTHDISIACTNPTMENFSSEKFERHSSRLKFRLS